MARVKKLSAHDEARRRWCIEKAMDWPIIPSQPGFNNNGLFAAYEAISEADVIARAAGHSCTP